MGGDRTVHFLGMKTMAKWGEFSPPDTCFPVRLLAGCFLNIKPGLMSSGGFYRVWRRLTGGH